MKTITINTNKTPVTTDIMTLAKAGLHRLRSHTKPTLVLATILVSFIAPGTALADWIAYNDSVYDSGAEGDGYIGTNVTTFGVGSGVTGDTSGTLLEQTSGDSTGITASFTESGNVNWQNGTEYGGADTAAETDASNTFATITDMIGTIQYGDAGWWVDLTFSNLDSSKHYTFATSSSRNDATYTDRYTQYTLSSVDAATNASTTGVTEIENLIVYYNTGDNHNEGYVARWTDIDPGDDNAFTIRAEAHPSADGGDGRKAYAFDVFMLEEVSIPEEEEDDFLLLLIPSITSGSN